MIDQKKKNNNFLLSDDTRTDLYRILQSNWDLESLIEYFETLSKAYFHLVPDPDRNSPGIEWVESMKSKTARIITDLKYIKSQAGNSGG